MSHGSLLRARTVAGLENLFSQIGECRKTLIIEKSLISLFDLPYSQMEKMGVVKVTEWTTDELTVQDESTHVYFQRSLSVGTVPLLTSLSGEILRCPKQRRVIVFCPVVTHVGVSRLHGLGGVVDMILGFPELQAVGLEDDVISMQLDGAFGEFHGRSNPSELELVAIFLRDLQEMFGLGLGHVGKSQRKFRRINAIGTAAKWVADAFLMGGARDENVQEMGVSEEIECTRGLGRVGGVLSIGGFLQKEVSTEEMHADENLAIDSVVLIDRRSDLFSVFCSQFTYEGLLGDCCPDTCALNDEDVLFKEIRNVHVSEIGGILSKKAGSISQTYKAKDSLKSISEIGEFMNTFKSVQSEHSSLSTHVALATKVTDFAKDLKYVWMLKLEDQIMSMSGSAVKIANKLESMIRQSLFETDMFTLERIAKLMCLTAMVYGSKSVERVLRPLLFAFGVPAVDLLAKLEKSGLFSLVKWPKLREEFRLILDANSIDVDGPLADAYAGYVPLSVRLVQLLNNSWKASAASLNLVRGPAVEIAQECPIATNGPNSTYVAVVFIGGVTVGEIATLRKLSQLEGGKRKFLIITTNVTNYAKLINSL